MTPILSNSTQSAHNLVQVWSTYDYCAATVWYLTGSVSIPTNIYLLFLITFKTPKSLKIYRIFMFNVALGDFVFGFSTTMAQIRIIPNKWAFAYVSLGPAGRMGYGYFAYCVMLHSLFYTFLCFPISFGFRYYILVKPVPKARNCIFFCFCLWLVALAQHVLFILSEAPEALIRTYLKQNKPKYDLDAFPVSGNHMLEKPITVITLLSIILPMFPIYVIVIYFYKKVQYFLRLNTTNMGKTTIAGHRILMQALTVQACLPLLFIFPPILLYDMYHLELIDYTIIEYLVYTLFSFFPACSPLVTIMYVKPFKTATKQYILRLLCRKSEVEEENVVKKKYNAAEGITRFLEGATTVVAPQELPNLSTISQTL